MDTLFFHLTILQWLSLSLAVIWSLAFWRGKYLKLWINDFGYKRLKLHYFNGINYLINEQPDQAIDTLLQLLKTDSDSLEIKMALANLFRQRGELDRAIRIHQDLVDQAKKTSKKAKAAALLELAKDYLAAGVFDRALAVIGQAQKLNYQPQTCLAMLQDIYQREKNWQAAITVVVQLLPFQNLLSKPSSVALSHYCCELAQDAISEKQLAIAASWLRESLHYDLDCARAYLMQANMAIFKQDYEKAIYYLRRASAIDLDYISEVVKPLLFCYQSIADLKSFRSDIEEWLSNHPTNNQVCVIANFLRSEKQVFANQDLLKDFFIKDPSYLSCRYFLAQLSSSIKPSMRGTLKQLELGMDQLLDNAKHYSCANCGFSGQEHYWSCPGCHQWAAMKVNY